MKKNPPPMNNKVWCVTARNRLTGEREMVTSPCTLAKAQAIHGKEIKKPARKRAYTYPKVSRYSYYTDHPVIEKEFNFKEQ